MAKNRDVYSHTACDIEREIWLTYCNSTHQFPGITYLSLLPLVFVVIYIVKHDCHGFSESYSIVGHLKQFLRIISLVGYNGRERNDVDQ